MQPKRKKSSRWKYKALCCKTWRDLRIGDYNKHNKKNLIRNLKSVPLLNQSLIVLLHKSGDKKQPEIDRPIRGI